MHHTPHRLRPVIEDVLALAHAVHRGASAAQIIDRAYEAGDWRALHGEPHPTLGPGNLSHQAALATRGLPVEPVTLEDMLPALETATRHVARAVASERAMSAASRANEAAA